MKKEKQSDKQFGDWQTPESLIKKILEKIPKMEYKSIFDPTCGVGNLLAAGSEYFGIESQVGIEINAEYSDYAKNRFKEASIINRSIFETDIPELPQPCLILGNPPWVLSSKIGKYKGNNLPCKKSNGNIGISQITGDGVFDLSENIIIKSVDSFKEGTVAFLCKTATAEKLFPKYKNDFNISIYLFDAKHYFNAAVDACLMILTKPNESIKHMIAKDLDSGPTELEYYNSRFFEKGKVPIKPIPPPELENLQWRSGIVNGATKLFELSKKDCQFRNHYGVVDIEEQFIFDFYSATELFHNKPNAKYVILPEIIKNINTKLEEYPKLKKFLSDNKEILSNRKSKVFSNGSYVFGVGDYSFKEWVISISTYHPDPRFRLFHNRPIKLFDSGTVLLSFDNEDLAKTAFKFLTSESVTNYLKQTVNIKSMRKYSVKSLNALTCFNKKKTLHQKIKSDKS